MYAAITSIDYHLADRLLDNDALASLYPGWTAEKILAKTGVRTRHIAAPEETASDLAARAADKLFSRGEIARSQIDVLIFCTQTPDYFLPSSSCLLQERLALRTDCGAFDVGLGCSGFVYCLALAKGLIESNQAGTVLILTADTYSKLINPLDKSVRTIFSDAGAATVVRGVAADEPAIRRCVMGTDGRGADRLIVPTGAFREPRTADSANVVVDTSGNARSRDDLFMDGADVLAFTLREVPKLAGKLLESAGIAASDVDRFICHQGSKFMLDALRKKMDIPPAKFVVDLAETGNTVSSTIPIACSRMMKSRHSPTLETVMLLGFGVGYSWAGTLVKI